MSERLLRYYEEQRLLRPARSANGYRVYAETDVTTVRRIRTLLAAGLSTGSIMNLLPCITETGEVLAPTCTRVRADLERECRRISTAIQNLQQSQTMLQSILGSEVTNAVATRQSDSP